MQKLIVSFGLFIFSFAVGFIFLNTNSDAPLIDRDPAAIKQNFDLSNLTGDSLQQAVKNRIVSGIELKKNTEGFGIGLGHFVFRGENGEKKTACQAYGKVHLTFIAEGVSVAGERPIMEIEGLCNNSQDLTRINPLFIPYEKIFSEKPGDGEFQFREGQPLLVRFSNLPEEWPKVWLLRSVKLENEHNNQNLTVENDDFARYLGHAVFLRF